MKKSPFQTSISKLYGLSPIKQDEEGGKDIESLDEDTKKDIKEDYLALVDYWNETGQINSLLSRRLKGEFLESENILDPYMYDSEGVTGWDTEIPLWMMPTHGYDVEDIKEKVRANLKNLGLDNISDLNPKAEKEWNWLNNISNKIKTGEMEPGDLFNNFQSLMRMRRLLNIGIEGSHMSHKKGHIQPSHQMTLSPGQGEYLGTDLLDIYGHEAGHGTLGNKYNLSERDAKIISKLQQIRSYRSGFEDKDITEHHEDVSENYADLQSVRLDMLRSGLYDWRKEQLTPEVWNEYLNTYKDKDMPLTLRRLIETFRVNDADMDDIKRKQPDAEKDQNIIYMNNVIALGENEESDKSSALTMRGFQTSASKLHGLSPFKDKTDVEIDPELVKKAKPVVNWMSEYMKSGTYDYLKKNMIENIASPPREVEWKGKMYTVDDARTHIEAGEEDALDYLENFPYQVDPETGLTQGPAIVEEKGEYTGAHQGRTGDVGGGKIKINPESLDIRSGYKSFEAVLAHELGHLEKGFFTQNTGISEEIISRNKLSQKIEDSQVWQTFIKENPEFKEKTPETARAFARFIRDNYNQDAFGISAADWHAANPAEVRSDLIRLRFVAEQKGVYKSTGEFKEFTQEDLDKMKEEDSSNRLFDNYEDEDLIWLMNNIAMTKEDIQDFTGNKLGKDSAVTMRVDKRSGL